MLGSRVTSVIRVELVRHDPFTLAHALNGYARFAHTRARTIAQEQQSIPRPQTCFELYEGLVDEVIVYKRILTSADVHKLVTGNYIQKAILLCFLFC